MPQQNDNAVVITPKGTRIQRYKGIVGKQMGSQIYLHKRYAYFVVPKEIMDAAFKASNKYYPRIQFNCIMYDLKTQAVRFDEALDFDTAREPHPGWRVTIQKDGARIEGRSNSIWHHRWLWVDDSYCRFDVAASIEWSRTWTSKFTEVAKGTDKSFNAQLEKFGLGKFVVDTDT